VRLGRRRWRQVKKGRMFLSQASAHPSGEELLCDRVGGFPLRMGNLQSATDDFRLHLTASLVVYTGHIASINLAMSLVSASPDRLNLRLVRASQCIQQFKLLVFRKTSTQAKPRP
jgi:hypothetical protein